MIYDLLYFFRRWRRRCKLIRVIEPNFPADSGYRVWAQLVIDVGGNPDIDWRELPLAKLELYANKCIENSESLQIKYPEGVVD